MCFWGKRKSLPREVNDELFESYKCAWRTAAEIDHSSGDLSTVAQGLPAEDTARLLNRRVSWRQEWDAWHRGLAKDLLSDNLGRALQAHGRLQGAEALVGPIRDLVAHITTWLETDDSQPLVQLTAYRVLLPVLARLLDLFSKQLEPFFSRTTEAR